MGENMARLQLDQLLDKYFTELDSLPGDLKRNYNQMRELDRKTQELSSQIDKETEEFLNETKTLTSKEKHERSSHIQKLFAKAKGYSDDKVQIAIKVYEMVDTHIRRLDSDMTNFESDLKANKNKKTDASINKNRKKGGDTQQNKRKNKGPENGGNKKRKRKKETESAISSLIPSLAANPGEAIDMPVDPNEPTYCLCHQVSYGEMIACDKLDCPIEWFHFACVNLTIKPKGKWYCPRCAVEKKKK